MQSRGSSKTVLGSTALSTWECMSAEGVGDIAMASFTDVLQNLEREGLSSHHTFGFLSKSMTLNTHPKYIIPIEDLWVILQRNAEQHLRRSSSRNRRGIVL